MTFIALLLLLLFTHALADYPLQGEFLATAKRGMVPGMPWWLGLSMHAMIHAGMVLVVTGNVWLALAEFVCHSAIDRAKCAGRINMVQDQALHVLCKLVWAAVVAFA